MTGSAVEAAKKKGKGGPQAKRGDTRPEAKPLAPPTPSGGRLSTTPSAPVARPFGSPPVATPFGSPPVAKPFGSPPVAKPFGSTKAPDERKPVSAVTASAGQAAPQRPLAATSAPLAPPKTKVVALRRLLATKTKRVTTDLQDARAYQELASQDFAVVERVLLSAQSELASAEQRVDRARVDVAAAQRALDDSVALYDELGRELKSSGEELGELDSLVGKIFKTLFGGNRWAKRMTKFVVSEREKELQDYADLGREVEANQRTLGRAQVSLAQAQSPIAEKRRAVAEARMKLEGPSRDLAAADADLAAKQAAFDRTTKSMTTRVSFAEQAIAVSNQHFHAIPATKRAAHRAAVATYKQAAFVIAKDGVSQDAFSAAPERGRWAIADGVSNSDLPAEFAQSLVRQWTDAPPQDVAAFDGFVETSRQSFRDNTSEKIAELMTLPYNRNKKVWSASAAFVGAEMRTPSKLRLMGTGDSVALLARNGKRIKSFPLSQSSEFSNSVRSLNDVGDIVTPIEATWDVQPGDEVFMLTDAIAAWAYSEIEAGRDPITTLRAIQSRGSMQQFVSDAQAGEGIVGGKKGSFGTAAKPTVMVEDDTAMIRFTIPAAK